MPDDRSGPPPSGPPPSGPPPSGPRGREDRARAAREALAGAKADALAKGNRPAPRDKPQSERNSPGRPSPPTRSSRRQRRDDPQPLDAAIGGLISDQGWALAAATGSVFGRWAQIVGPELAAHTAPDGLADGELTISVDSTAWATQVRLLAGQLVRRLNAELGDGVVRAVKVRGPATAARRPGEWRVRGSRGPRDTYG